MPTRSVCDANHVQLAYCFGGALIKPMLCSLIGAHLFPWNVHAYDPLFIDTHTYRGSNQLLQCSSLLTYGTIHLPCMMIKRIPDNKVYGASMGPTRGQQDPGGPHVSPMNLAIWDIISIFWCISVPCYIHQGDSILTSCGDGVLLLLLLLLTYLTYYIYALTRN